ncbi:hypothetical protein DL95DRAFT_154978 [Leptodontidium sp. 2 PMI_412]|nr:hypothetical protein BKA61DRAFT_50958 [Leptodontidium sp. MPI-SDFR-AT-0119]KAH9214143.1 hypothetical protein DL95DRAFT_154978 [Leptodontidium sp. 2 PMI_412]
MILLLPILILVCTEPMMHFGPCWRSRNMRRSPFSTVASRVFQQEGIVAESVMALMSCGFPVGRLTVCTANLSRFPLFMADVLCQLNAGFFPFRLPFGSVIFRFFSSRYSVRSLQRDWVRHS